MELSDAIHFIRPIQHTRHAVWADLGCGSGLFTLALDNLLEGSTIHAIDRSSQKLPPSVRNTLAFHQLDFTRDKLPFSEAAGILMANSLHYVVDPQAFLESLKRLLIISGQLVIIEYDTDRANEWVPYPIPAHLLSQLLSQCGFDSIKVIGEKQSIYGRKMYAMVAVKAVSSH